MKRKSWSVAVVPFLLVASASAQQDGDSAVCAQLNKLNRTGLFIFYPSMGPGGTVQPLRSSMPYSASARFFYYDVASARGSEEGVWHIRTQTTARVRKGTDTALVYRPGVQTRCDPRGLRAFDENERFVPLTEYQRYHTASRNDQRSSTALQQGFHFRIMDERPDATVGCVSTDDRGAYPDLATVYGFDSEASNAVARNFAVVSAVSAIPHNTETYDGLSSEFAYDIGGTGRAACFGFTMALPTGGLSKARFSLFGKSNLERARDAGEGWAPSSTSVLIKQLRGRNVVQVFRRTIEWSR